MRKSLKEWLQAVMFMCLLSVLAACGADEKGGNGGNSSQPQQTTTGSETLAPKSAAFPRTVKDAFGDVTIEKKPEKVAVVHWGYTGSIVIFDIPSLAIVLPFSEKQSVMKTEPYKTYADKLDELVTVGTNTEVNMEALLAYNPDVIIAGNRVNEKVVDQLNKIASTVVLDEETLDVFTDWKPVVTKFGEILGQESLVADYISGFDKTVATAKAALTHVEGKVAFTQVRADAVWLQGKEYTNHYYAGLGLKPLEGEAGQKGEQLSLEGLSQLNPDHLFLGYFNRTDTSLGALTDQWESSEVWKRLDAVKHNRVYRVDGSIVFGYGPVAQAYGIQEIVKALQ